VYSREPKPSFSAKGSLLGRENAMSGAAHLRNDENPVYGRKTFWSIKLESCTEITLWGPLAR
jgi:hypothetical protein